MDWENERYVRVYTRDTGDILAIGWEGRAVLWELMRKVDRAGVLDEDDTDILAEFFRLPHDVAKIGFDRLLKRRVIERKNGVIVIPNFIEAQEAKQSDKQRQAESRARRREKARAGKLSQNVTDDIQMDIDSVTDSDSSVTVGHGGSQSVTPSLAVPSLAVPSLAENSRDFSDSIPDIPANQFDKPPGWSILSVGNRKILDSHIQQSSALWKIQDDLRSELGGRGLKPTAERLLQVAKRLEAGATVEECELVLSQFHSEALKSKDSQWFNGSTNWRPENFTRALGKASSGYPSGSTQGSFALGDILKEDEYE